MAYAQKPRLERLAEWYLVKRRGRAVLPRSFVGFAMGFGVAVRKGGDNAYSTYEVTVPKGSRLIALNNSIVLPLTKDLDDT